MLDVREHPFFREWRDPVSGAVSYRLIRKPAPLVQSFYFVNNCLTKDERYLWFYCAFPPSGSALAGRMLGRVDFAEGTALCFPETQFGDASPLVDEETGAVYWTSGCGIWRRGPRPGDAVQQAGEFPASLAKGRTPHRIATHLTFSADRRHLNIDAEIGAQWFVGDLDLPTGTFTLWQEMDVCYNHGQFSPVDNTLQLIAQDGWVDCVTGARKGYDNRMWLLRKGEAARPVFPGSHPDHGHEWWSPDGRRILYVDYRSGTWSWDLATGRSTLLWAGRPCHAHATADETLLVCDTELYGEAPGAVLFYDARRRRSVAIVTALRKSPLAPRRYHTDPHPRFIGGDRWIVYTVPDEDGLFTLALARVSDLVAAASGA